MTSSRSEQLLTPAVLNSLGRLDLIARTVVEGFLAGHHKSPYRGLSHDFAEHRQYVPGDEVRRIDWKLYGRTDRLFIKKFEDETNSPIRILLDVSRSLDFGSTGVSKLRYAAMLAAAIAYIGIRRNDRVGLTCFDGDVTDRLPARGSERQLQSVFSLLARLTAGDRRTKIAPVLLAEAATWKRKGIVVLISDLYDSPSDVTTSAALIRRAGHELIVFNIVDPVEKSLPTSGVFEFADLETGDRMIIDAARARDSYRKKFTERLAFFRREFQRAGVDYAEFETSEPLDRALAAFLRNRKFRSSRAVR